MFQLDLLKGKRILVSGGATGLGRSMSCVLVQEGKEPLHEGHGARFRRVTHGRAR